MQVNLVGTYLCCRSAIPLMLRQDRGRIINLSGSGGSTAAAHISAYCSSKAAVVRLTECLALELADANVQVNALGPGGIHTRLVEEMQEDAAASGSDEIYDQSRNVTSGGGESLERVADLAVFLAGDQAGTLSGRLVSTRDGLPTMPSRIPEIMTSDAYLLRLVPLP